MTRTPKAAPADLGVPAFRDASERESAVWRLKPPKGREWVLAIAELTTAAPVQRVEHFYRKALGDPEIRRTSAKSGNLVVLSRVKGLGPEKEPSETSRESESIVVRLTQDAGAKLTTIVIRRAVRGAPVKLEPSGDLPGRPRPKPRPRPRATPV
ncbi:MAG: hypothetical protein JSV65_13420 [Armatimonadota bacterium]|nr:MAG: hypothetical protein JSV65_13420 [Armatimonadota bacterium]